MKPQSWCLNCVEAGLVNVVRPQRDPREGTGPPIAELVVLDIEKRMQDGISKYGTPLRANNGRAALVDAYQEAIDLVMYLRQEIEERRSGST